MKLKEDLESEFSEFKEYFLDELFDILDVEEVCQNNAEQLNGTWDVRTWYLSQHMFALNVKGKGLGDYDKANKDNRLSDKGYNEEDYWRYNDENNTFFYNEWNERFQNEIGIDLAVGGRSGGWWGFYINDIEDNKSDIFEVSDEAIKNLWDTKAPTLFADANEFDDEVDYSEIGQEVADELSADEVSEIVHFKKSFIDLCNEFAESIDSTSSYMEDDTYNDEVYNNMIGD